jgi:hypothetical protein
MIEQPMPMPMHPEEIQEVLEDLGVYRLFPSPEEARTELKAAEADPRKQSVFNSLRKGEITLDQARERMRQIRLDDGHEG